MDPVAELTLDHVCRRGERGRAVRRIQEWLVLNGQAVATDGAFGPATEAAVERFQELTGLKADGVVRRDTFDALVAPMRDALNPLTRQPRRLGACIVAHARQHLRQHPREVGGENAGPWVRLYMDGHEGPEWRWCAGFATFVLQQACATLDRPLPMPASFSCDVLATNARARDLLVPGGGERPDGVIPGSLFLVRRTSTDWVHVGIVLQANEESMRTVEGNTNDSGSPDGFEVCERTRNYAGKDFVVWDQVLPPA